MKNSELANWFEARNEDEGTSNQEEDLQPGLDCGQCPGYNNGWCTLVPGRSRYNPEFIAHCRDKHPTPVQFAPEVFEF
jgi:hypothetical protein